MTARALLAGCPAVSLGSGARWKQKRVLEKNISRSPAPSLKILNKASDVDKGSDELHIPISYTPHPSSKAPGLFWADFMVPTSSPSQWEGQTDQGDLEPLRDLVLRRQRANHTQEGRGIPGEPFCSNSTHSLASTGRKSFSWLSLPREAEI